MADINRLKNRARREEQRENWSRAIDLYMQALAASEKKGESVGDLSLYNRIGDIHLRIGDQDKAVELYEKAIDRYAEQDLHSSAIALCNKVLRVLPARTGVYLKLGQLQLTTGLLAEARVNFLRFATEISETDSDAGLEALEEFAALTGDPEVVSRFADELAMVLSPEQAAERLRTLRDTLAAGGRDSSELELRLEDFDDVPTDVAVEREAAANPRPEPVSMDDLEAELDVIAPARQPEVIPADESITEPEPAPGPEEKLEVVSPTFADLEAELEAALDVDFAFTPPAPAPSQVSETPAPVEAGDFDKPAEFEGSEGIDAAAGDEQATEARVAAEISPEPSDDAFPPEPFDPVYVASQRDGIDGIVEMEAAPPAEPSPRAEDSELSIAARLHSALFGTPFVSDAPDPPLQRDDAANRKVRRGNGAEKRETQTPVPTDRQPGPFGPPASPDDPEIPYERAAATQLLADGLRPYPAAGAESREAAGTPGGVRPTHQAGHPEGQEASVSAAPAGAAAPRRLLATDPTEFLIVAAAARAGIQREIAASRPLSLEPRELSEHGSARPLEPVLGLRTLLPEVWEGPVNGGATLEELVASSMRMAVDVASPASGVSSEPLLSDRPAELTTSDAVAPKSDTELVDSDQQSTNGLLTSFLGAEESEPTARPVGSLTSIPSVAPLTLEVTERVSRLAAPGAPASPSPELVESARSLPPDPPAHQDHPAESAEPSLPDHLAVHYARGVDLREAGDLEAAVDEFGLALGSPAEFAHAAEQLLECRTLVAELAAESADLASVEEHEVVAIDPSPVVELETADEPIPDEVEESSSPVEVFEPEVAEEEPSPVVEPEVAEELSPPETGYAPTPQEDAVSEPVEIEPVLSAQSPDTVQAAMAAEEDPYRSSADVDDPFREFVSTAPAQLLPRALEELEERSEFDKALLVVDRLIELNGPDPALYGTRARCATKAGNSDLAARTYMKLGKLLEARADTDGAREAYRDLLSVAPEHGPALAALEELQEGTRSRATERPSKDPMFESRSVTSGANRGSMTPASRIGSGPAAVPTSPSPHSSPSPSTGPGPDNADHDDLRPYGGLAGGAEGSLDFDALLTEFKAQLAEGTEEADTRTRTELGASLKDMGLLDDAIRELQAAVGEPSAEPVAYELLGEAFIEKGQPRVATRILQQSIEKLSVSDREILGVLYQLGFAYQQVNELSSALECFERIFSVDIDYRDVQDRIAACSR